MKSEWETSFRVTLWTTVAVYILTPSSPANDFSSPICSLWHLRSLCSRPAHHFYLHSSHCLPSPTTVNESAVQISPASVKRSPTRPPPVLLLTWLSSPTSFFIPGPTWFSVSCSQYRMAIPGSTQWLSLHTNNPWSRLTPCPLVLLKTCLENDHWPMTASTPKPIVLAIQDKNLLTDHTFTLASNESVVTLVVCLFWVSSDSYCHRLWTCIVQHWVVFFLDPMWNGSSQNVK